MRRAPVLLPPNAVSLSQAKELVRCLAAEQSVLLLAPPGVGKSDLVAQAAREAGLEVRSLLGTQIAPEDVSGVPRVVNERAVFCPPRTLLGDGKPFCLFLDELPASPPDVQKAFYSLLLERRIGEFALPKGTWVVAAGNRSEDRAVVRTLSSALVNRVFVVYLKVDRAEWLAWAEAAGIRGDIRAFVGHMRGVLQRPVPPDPVPFSTPRSWALLSRDLDLAEAGGRLTPEERRALAFGRVSPQDAALFCTLCEDGLAELKEAVAYLDHPEWMPPSDTGKWFLVSRIRGAVAGKTFTPPPTATGAVLAAFQAKVNAFLLSFPEEFRFALLVDHVRQWADLGASDAMLAALRDVTGV